MSRSDVQDTLKEMWETRPARPRGERQVAGVAAGVARRYDIDPVLVRVGFVVAAFSGIGAALYIAGWILLPDEPTDPAERPARPRSYLVVGLAIAAAITVGTLFGGNGPDVLFPLLAVGGLLYLLHRSRGGRDAPTAATAQAPAVATSASESSGPSLVKEQAHAGDDQTTASAAAPPAWDPLGAAPFAWDLPEPAPVPAAPPPRKAPVTPVTLGLALIAGSATAVIMLLAGSLMPANLPVLLGVVLAVLGGGLLVGAFLHTGRGLIPFALLLAVLAWSVVAAPLDRWQGNGWGELHAAPTTVAELQPSYQRTAGEIVLDLRDLDLAVPPGGNATPARTTISLGAGDVAVQVPHAADITLTGTIGVGDLWFDERRESGPGAQLRVIDDLGSDGVRNGRPLILDIEAGAGDVEVLRG